MRQQRNSKELIAQKKIELEVAQSSSANDIALITSITQELTRAYEEE